MPEGVQIVDGADDIRHAVREQVKYGADWIKYYSDRRYFLKDGALHSWVNFTDEEAQAIVEEAHRLGRKVAAHAMGRDGIVSALRAGVDTIEHGDGLDEETIDLHGQARRLLVPDHLRRRLRGRRPGRGRRAHLDHDGRPGGAGVRQGPASKGVKIAYGTDAGGYAWTENQAKEFTYMVKYGMTPMQAIQSATIGRGGAARPAGQPGRDRSREVRRHHRRRRRPAERHRGAGAREVRDEGRGGGGAVR